MDTETKTCSKCGEVKPVDAFERRRITCKSCRSAEIKAWREANHEKVQAQRKAWRDANREKLRANGKAWQEANPEKVSASIKAWREANHEKVRAQRKSYYEANAENIMARSKAWRDANPEKVRAYDKYWRAANIAKVRSNEKARRDELNDSYIKHLVVQKTQISTPEIPQDLIEMKREQVATLREVKRLIEALKEKEND